MNKKEILKHYTSLPYPITIYPEANDGDGYLAEIKDLPGCMGVGETIEEALESIQGSKEFWIELALEKGGDIPLPTHPVMEKPEVRVLLRLPGELHSRLVRFARRRKISLNRYIIDALEESVTTSPIQEKLRTSSSYKDDKDKKSYRPSLRGEYEQQYQLTA